MAMLKLMELIQEIKLLHLCIQGESAIQCSFGRFYFSMEGKCT